MTIRGAFQVLPVSDMAAALAFWEGVLGCSRRFETPTFSEVAAGDHVICLRRSRSAGSASGLGVDVADLEAACEAIAASAGTVVRGPDAGPVPGLRIASATDPDGNRFELTEHTTPA